MVLAKNYCSCIITTLFAWAELCRFANDQHVHGLLDCFNHTFDVRVFLPIKQQQEHRRLLGFGGACIAMLVYWCFGRLKLFLGWGDSKAVLLFADCSDYVGLRCLYWRKSVSTCAFDHLFLIEHRSQTLLQVSIFYGLQL